MDRYIKHKTTKDILLSMDENDLSIEAAQKILTDEDKAVSDYEIGTATFEEIKVWNMETFENMKTYADKRRDEYPEIGDQLDMLWHGMNDGILTKVDSFYNAIKTVKDKYEKE